MVEPLSLTLGSAVASLVTKAASGVGEELGTNLTKGAAAVLHRLVGRLRARFSETDDEAGALALAQLEEVPDSPTRERALSTALARHVEEDNRFWAELEEFVAEAQDAGLHIQTVTQSVVGNANVQVAGLADSSINVSYGASSPRPNA